MASKNINPTMPSPSFYKDVEVVSIDEYPAREVLVERSHPVSEFLFAAKDSRERSITDILCSHMPLKSH